MAIPGLRRCPGLDLIPITGTKALFGLAFNKLNGQRLVCMVQAKFPIKIDLPVGIGWIISVGINRMILPHWFGPFLLSCLSPP